MSEPKFTPGPWAWFGNTKHYYYLATTHSGRLYVMGFARKGMHSGQPTFRGPKGHMVTASEIPIFEVCRDAESAEDERVYRNDIVGFRSADAHLIAAAPELYDALNEIIHYTGGADSALDDDYVMDRARRALAKARGEA